MDGSRHPYKNDKGRISNSSPRAFGNYRPEGRAHERSADACGGLKTAPPALLLACTKITLIVHTTMSSGPPPSTLFSGREPMFPRELINAHYVACAYPRFWKAPPANSIPTSLARTHPRAL